MWTICFLKEKKGQGEVKYLKRNRTYRILFYEIMSKSSITRPELSQEIHKKFISSVLSLEESPQSLGMLLEIYSLLLIQTEEEDI